MEPSAPWLIVPVVWVGLPPWGAPVVWVVLLLWMALTAAWQGAKDVSKSMRGEGCGFRTPTSPGTLHFCAPSSGTIDAKEVSHRVGTARAAGRQRLRSILEMGGVLFGGVQAVRARKFGTHRLTKYDLPVK